MQRRARGFAKFITVELEELRFGRAELEPWVTIFDYWHGSPPILNPEALTRCRELVERADARSIRILYASDFDPGGLSMPVAAAVKIGWLNEGGVAIRLHPVVLTYEQCIEYRLPRTPIKDTEARGARFEAWFGEGATELDALEALRPGELRRILVREIERFHDPHFAGEWEEARREAQNQLDEITAHVLARHAEQPFARRLANLKRQANRLIADVRRYNAGIAQEMADAAPDADDFEWPEPREADEWPDPLFDSGRGYIEQIDRYKRHQDKPTSFKMPVLKPYICEHCGGSFTAVRPAKWCSARCRDKPTKGAVRQGVSQ